jgi:hypothetical protein
VKTLDKDTKNLLAKEAALSSMNLGVGLTFIRKYDFAALGFIYQSFFSLSVGLERLMKLILLYEYIYINNSYPDLKYLKSKGHKLTDLFIEVRKLVGKYSCDNYFTLLDKDPIFEKIIQNLSDFATDNRYFHLNKLSGHNKTEDPVIRWDKEINSIIIKRHFNPNLKKNIALQEIAKIMSEFTVVSHHDENDNEINDYKQLTDASIQIETKQKYGMYYAFCIIKALCHLQESQNHVSRTDIHLEEFFMVFRADYNYAKRTKTWNPHPPYRF